jgi:CPA1 family monovalent cation:H+ antiporter
VPPLDVTPDVVLAVLLPPLLYAAAFESSAVAIRQLIRPIFQLSVVLVLLTAFTVAQVLTLVIPGLPFAAALALGAIVAPPDAVAAVALARRVGLPRNLVTVLEGESLFNDATSLVTLKVAIAAIGATTVAWAPAIGEFVWASVGGLLIGLALGLVLSYARRKAESALTITALSLVAPFAAYLLGEAAHASGVLVVVVTGLVLGYRSPTEVQASVRLTETATWATLRFVLEGAVFALIGLQLRSIVGSLDPTQDNVFVAITAVVATVIVSRPVWLVLIHLVSRLGRSRDPVGWKGVAAVSWAGMRGVVSLAAAQSLPLDTPQRSLLLVCTIAVIVGTLILQGLSLPWVIRRLGIVKDHRADDERERADAHARAGRAINDQVDSMCNDGQLSDRQAELMRKWAALRDWRNWDDDDKSREFGRRLGVLSDWRRSLLGIERSVIVSMRNDGDLSEDVLREMQHDLDLEEALLERRSLAVDGHLDELPPGEGAEPPADAEAAGAGAAGAGADGAGAAGAGADNAEAPVDEAATVDDAEVSALLLDEQTAEGAAVGRTARRPAE